MFGAAVASGAFGHSQLFLVLSAVFPIAVELGILALLVFLGTAFERRYRGRQVPTRDAICTDELIIDPVSGKRLRVYYDRNTGERAYVEERPPA